jgi:hypothetical protein
LSFSFSTTPSLTKAPISTTTPLTTSTTTPIPTPTPTPTFTPTSIPTPNQVPQPLPSPTPEPPQQDGQTQDNQITIISLTSPIKRGNNAKLEIQTIPGTECSIKVTLPSGTVSGAQGLQGVKISDGSGYIPWEWRIAGNTKPGTSTIEVTCTKNGSSFSKTIQMVITE